jgi:hypothetical protein
MERRTDMRRTKWCLGLVAIAVTVAAIGCATMNVPMPSPVPTSDAQAQQIEDGLSLVYTLYLAGSIKESEWLVVKKAYDEYRGSVLELQSQHEKYKAGEPIDLTEYTNTVVNKLTAFWLAQIDAAGVDIRTESSNTGGDN